MFELMLDLIDRVVERYCHIPPLCGRRSRSPPAAGRCERKKTPATPLGMTVWDLELGELVLRGFGFFLFHPGAHGFHLFASGGNSRAAIRSGVD